MKNIIVIITATLALSLAACGDNLPAQSDEGADASTSQSELTWSSSDLFAMPDLIQGYVHQVPFGTPRWQKVPTSQGAVYSMGQQTGMRFGPGVTYSNGSPDIADINIGFISPQGNPASDSPDIQCNGLPLPGALTPGTEAFKFYSQAWGAPGSDMPPGQRNVPSMWIGREPSGYRCHDYYRRWDMPVSFIQFAPTPYRPGKPSSDTWRVDLRMDIDFPDSGVTNRYYYQFIKPSP